MLIIGFIDKLSRFAVAQGCNECHGDRIGILMNMGGRGLVGDPYGGVEALQIKTIGM